MTNGSLMDEMQWKSKGGGSQDVIYYGVYLNGILQEPINHFTGVGNEFRNFGLRGGPGNLFDEIRLVATIGNNGTPFAANQNVALIMDDLAVNALNPPTAVPEPTAWALFISGLGGVGARLRRRRAFQPFA